MDTGLTMAVKLLVLLVCAHACLAGPVLQKEEDTLPDILKQLHDVLDSLRTYLQTQQNTKTDSSDSSPEEIVHQEPPHDMEGRNEDEDESALESKANDVSLRDVLSYLLELERERQAHSAQKSHQQRDHDIPFPFADKNSKSGHVK